MKRSFVLHGTICYSQTPQTLRTVPDGYVVCEDGICRGVYEQLPGQWRDLPLEDWDDALILPGLIDLHTHAPQYAFRGMGMDKQLLDWLETYTFPEEAKYAQPAYAARAYEIFVRDLADSATTRACIFGTLHVPATLELMRQLETTGLICYVGKVNMDRNSPDCLCEVSAEQSGDATEQWLRACPTDSRIRPILTPRFVPSCSDALMERLHDLQQRYQLPVQSHLSENRSEIEWVKQLNSKASSYADAYRMFDLFGGDVPTIMAHCVSCEPQEIELLRARGVYVAHCPQSNENLASGIAPVRRYLEEGICIGLGTDMAAGSTLSIFRAMGEAVQMSKLYWRYVDDQAKPLTAAEAFYLGTKGGGSFFGKVGSFEDGYELDAVVMDDSALYTPLELRPEQRLERLLYLSDQCVMRRKYVAGEACGTQA